MAWLTCGPLLVLASADVSARIATARIARVSTAVATLEGVEVRLEWPVNAAQGTLRLQARLVDAPDLGYRFRNLDWRCPLQRNGQGGWRCAGELRGAPGRPSRLALDLGVASTDASLSRGDARLALHRSAATPDATVIDLTRVPLAWTQALLSQAWPDARITGGNVDGRLAITSPKGAPLRIAGPLTLRGAALDTPDGTIAAENIGAQLAIDASLGARDRVTLDGQLRGGELLFGTTYVSLQARSVALQVEATHQGTQGWKLPRIAWRDDGVLALQGSAAFTTDAALHDLDVQLHSDDLGPLRDAYLSGWLGMAGLAELELSGAADAHVRVENGELRGASVSLREGGMDDPRGRFDFEGLAGDIRFASQGNTAAASPGAPIHSELRWRGGALYGLAFGPARLPFASGDGQLRLREAMTLPILGGSARVDHLQVRPPSGGQGLDIRFGLALDGLDVGQLAKALDWPAFTGELSGNIPEAHYADDRLTFDGGLAMRLFGGDVVVSSLAMERPFGVAPTLSADIALEDIDLESLTGVFGFGTITGALDGRVAGLRLVDWEAVAFDAQLHTDPKRGVRQRISQRAVQDLSSVGDASLVTSLQSRLIGLFDDFGYSRLGIACRLADEVCTMDGLGSAGQGFIIVQGSGLPRLTVVGFNRRVDWPTLVERLGAVGKGDVKPVVE